MLGVAVSVELETRFEAKRLPGMSVLKAYSVSSRLTVKIA